MSARTDIINTEINQLTKELEKSKSKGDKASISKLQIELENTKLHLVYVKNEEKRVADYLKNTYSFKKY